MKRSLYMMSLVCGLVAAQAMQAAAAKSDLASKYPSLYEFTSPNGSHWIDSVVKENHFYVLLELFGQIYGSKEFQTDQKYRKTVMSEIDAFLDDNKATLDKFIAADRRFQMSFGSDFDVALRTLKNKIPTSSEIKKKVESLIATYPTLAAVRGRYGDYPLITWATSTEFHKGPILSVLMDSLDSKKALNEFKAFMDEYALEVSVDYLKGRLKGVEYRITD